MSNARLDLLFHRYISQVCSEEEEEEFLALISDSEHHHQFELLLEELWENTSDTGTLPATRKEQILEEIFAVQHERIIPVNVNHNQGWKWFGVAASLLVGLMIGGYWHLYRHQPPALSVTPVQQPHPAPAEHRFIKLADNSTVILNEGSTLDYPDSFDNLPTREVTLTGEGYFDIKHDASKPFIVHAGKLTTTVLGTAFNIKAYTQEKDITVTVIRGKVKVEEGKQLYGVVTPDQQIVFNKDALHAAQQVVDSHHIISWMEKDVFFDDITLEEATAELEKRFNVKITFSNSKIKDCRFTVTFVKGENLDQILSVICEFNQATYQHDGKDKIIINGSGC